MQTPKWGLFLGILLRTSPGVYVVVSLFVIAPIQILLKPLKRLCFNAWGRANIPTRFLFLVSKSEYWIGAVSSAFLFADERYWGKTMRSITGKLSLAIVLVSLISIFCVVVVTQIALDNQAEQVTLEKGFAELEAGVDAYTKNYGSWQRAIGIESFGKFLSRRSLGFGGLSGQNNVSGYVLADTHGTVLLGSVDHQVGATLPGNLLQVGRAIQSNGQEVAIAVQVANGAPDKWTSILMESVYSGLKYGLIIAIGIALLAGFWIGRYLTAPLRKLTQNLIDKRNGKQYEKFELETQDEVELLVEVFKRMRSDLDLAQDDLRKARKMINRQAKQLSEIRIRDEITKLYNQRHFNERGGELFARSKRHDHPLCCVIADVNRFTQINEKLSHKIGDEVLRKMADILRSSTRETDVVGRYLGGKFVVAFSETPLNQAKVLCGRLSGLVEEYDWKLIHPKLSVTIRIGLCADMGLDNFEQMVAVADTKLYLAKDQDIESTRVAISAG